MTEHIIPGRPARLQEFEDHPLTYEQRTVAATAVGFASIHADANKAIIVVETATMRWRDDGTDPTSSVGTNAFVNTTIVLDGRDRINKFRAIRTGGTSSKLSINYYERK